MITQIEYSKIKQRLAAFKSSIYIINIYVMKQLCKLCMRLYETMI